MAGENSAACAKATRSAGLALWLMAAKATSFLGSCMIHRPRVVLLRLPTSIILLPCVITHSNSLKCASHLWSHSCPMEMSDVSPRAGKMCAVRAARGRLSMGSSPVCVDGIVS